jgi:ADP-ribosylglycohydrolase
MQHYPWHRTPAHWSAHLLLGLILPGGISAISAEARAARPETSVPSLNEKLAGALYGGAIGEAMGAPVEGWPPAKIAGRFKPVAIDDFLPPTHSNDPATGKGNGRITDDTLMVEALIRAYGNARDHLDAHGFQRFLLPEVAQTRVWVPERRQEMPILERLFWPEKYPWIRLAINNCEPRNAGMGNMVNCGVAMYAWPAGAVNLGDPAAAYQEAVAYGLAHNESYALEAGAVMAACAAVALMRDASIDQILQTARAFARDGTARAIHAALDSVRLDDDLEQFIQRTRLAVTPYDQRPSHTSDDTLPGSAAVSAFGRPSRLASIEELPVALAALGYGRADFLKTLRAAVFYGRDCDSIAGMAATLWGAVYGIHRIPERLRVSSDQANRRNFGELAAHFEKTIHDIFARDAKRWEARRRELSPTGKTP